MPNKRHAIIKTNGGLDYRCIYAMAVITWAYPKRGRGLANLCS